MRDNLKSRSTASIVAKLVFGHLIHLGRLVGLLLTSTLSSLIATLGSTIPGDVPFPLTLEALDWPAPATKSSPLATPIASIETSAAVSVKAASAPAPPSVPLLVAAPIVVESFPSI